MATSRNSGHSRQDTHSRPRLGGLGSLSRYDALLAAMPLVFALALSGHVLLSIPLVAAVGSGALASALLLVDALYLNPPASPRSGSPR